MKSLKKIRVNSANYLEKHRYTVPDAAQSLEIRANLLYGWKQQFEDKQSGNVLNGDERSELMNKLRLLNNGLTIK